MASGEELPEVAEQLKRLAEADLRNRRLFRAIMMTIFSVVIMAVGIKVIGIAHHVGFDMSWWDTQELEIGLFATLLGTIFTTLSLNDLISTYKQ